MARLPLPPSPPACTPVKKQPGVDTTTARTPGTISRRKCRLDRFPVTIPSGSPLADSVAVKRCGELDLTPMTVPTCIKREPDASAGECKDAGGKTLGTVAPRHKKHHHHCLPTKTTLSDISSSGAVAGRRRPYPHARPTAAEAPIMRINRCRLVRLLRSLAHTHRWRDAADVFSVLLPGIQHPDSFEEARSIFVAAMDIHRRLAEDGGIQLGGRSRYYLRTRKVFDVWIRRLIWLPTCAKKHLVKLELALFYLSQGNIDNAYNSTRTLITKDGIQTEPTLNLMHGLISYDKWYSGLPKDMQLEEFDVYKKSCTIFLASNGCGENGFKYSSDDNCSTDVDDATFRACSSESSINNGKRGKNWKISKKSCSFYPLEENYSFGSEVKEEVIYTDFRSVFFNTSDTPTRGLEKCLLPLRLKDAAGTSNGCFDSYWKYKSTPNPFYADAERCLRVALYSSPPVMAAFLPLIQILLLGDKLKDALCELEKICGTSTAALPFRLRGRLVEYYDQNQVSTISCCYEESLRRDPSCSYSVERLTEMHRKGYYNTVRLLEAIALHLDSVNGKPFIWEELVSCFIRLFSDGTTDNQDCISCNVEGDAATNSFSSLSSVFCEQHTIKFWKLRCKWWMNHHFSQNSYMSETVKGDGKLLVFKAACAAHLFGPEFQYVEAVKSYLSKQEANGELGFLSRNMQISVKLLHSLEKLT